MLGRKPVATDNFRAAIEFQLEAMKDVLRILEEGIREVGRKEGQEIRPATKINMLTSDGLKQWKAIISHQQIYGFELPLRIRYSFVLQLYTLFETGGLALCDEITKRKGLKLAVNDLAGERSFKGIRIFFSKVFPVGGINWSILKNLKDIRNCVVHYAGVVKGSNQETPLRKLATSSPQKLLLLKSGYIFPYRSYCADLLRAVTNFFERVFIIGNFGQRLVQYRIGNAQELIDVLREENA
jgi:hypothetical protein